MKPRITIYALNDTTYSTQIYSYNAFSDSGSTAKPISLQFESNATTAGTFSLEIEDSDGTLDPESLLKGNRIFIECSNTGSIWQPAFKGLVRSCERYLFGAQGSTYKISGYSYLVRLNERIINVIKESSLTGSQYNRTDSTMFTNNLLNDLLTTDSNYVYDLDDTARTSLFKTSNIASSPINTWIPRLDAQLVPLSNAISSILEFTSTAVLIMDPSNDQLALFDPQQVTTGVNVFLLTDQYNPIADDAAITMYPVEPYKYDVSYDYPDTGSRLIASIGNAGGCPGNLPDPQQPDPLSGTSNIDVRLCGIGTTANNETYINVASQFTATQTSYTTPISFAVATLHLAGTPSMTHTSTNIELRDNATGDLPGAVLYQALVYRDGVPGTAFNQTTNRTDTLGFPACDFILSTQSSDPGISGLTIGHRYWMCIKDRNTDQSYYDGGSGAFANFLGARVFDNTGRSASSTNDGASWTAAGTVNNASYLMTNVGNSQPVPSGGFTPPCGGLPTLADADPVFAVAEDKNLSKRLGEIERVMSDVPTHVRTAQTMNEYLFAKLFTASKPRFTFDFPSVTIPTKIPKAGDIVTHVSRKANVGTRITPVQTGVILSVNYDFRQDDEGVIGLTKMGLSTTGIRRGYY